MRRRPRDANVKDVFESLSEEPELEFSRLRGVGREHDNLLQESVAGLIDLVDVGAGARTENYEIAAYESLRRMAKDLGQEKAVAPT